MKARFMASILLVGVCLLITACFGVKIGAGDMAMNHQAMVKQSLDQLVSAYETKNSRQFSELVSERYVGEKAVLETAVRRDFSVYTNIALRYTFNNVTFDNKDKVFATVTLTREWTDVKTAKALNETKEISLVFVLENGNFKLYSQTSPLLFGLN